MQTGSPEPRRPPILCRLYASPPNSHGGFAPPPPTTARSHPSPEKPVLDAIMLVIGLGAFAVLAAYVLGCEQV